MDGAFACPECANTIEPVGLSPGREVLCDWCGATVEVPYIPRAEPIQRMRHQRRSRASRRRLQFWFGLATALFALVVSLLVAERAYRFQRRSAQSTTLNELLEAATQAETARRFGEALVALESALTVANSGECPDVDRDSLHARRDRLAWLDAEAQLRALDSTNDDPGRAVGHGLTLRLRVARDPALSALGERVEEVLERLRLRRVEAEAAAAHAAEEASRFADAVDLAAQVYEHAVEIAAAPRTRWQADASSLAARVIGLAGVIVEPVRGQYTLGSRHNYDAVLQPMIATSLRNAGYLPKSRATAWDPLWASAAPYRLTSEVLERDAGTYLSSPNRLSRIELKLTLSRHGVPIWSGDPNASTSVPVPGISAYQASRAAVSSQRSIEFERLLYENARANLIDRLGTFLHNLPSRAPGAPSAIAGG